MNASVKKIRCIDMLPGKTYGLAFYSDRETILKGILVSRPYVPVLNMNDSDRYVVKLENGETVEFFRNACPPHYLECKRQGRRGLKNTRVVFFDIGGVATQPKTASTALVVVAQPKRVKPTGQELVTPDVIYLHGPKTDFAKPNRDDYETKGKYDYAMKKWRKMQQAA